MTEGIVRIYLSYVEPEDKNLLWMRPYLRREGYELLYFGAKGWTKWLPCCDIKQESPENFGDIEGEGTCTEIPEESYEPEYPKDKDTPCGCL